MDSSVYNRLFEIDRQHWWFRGRLAIFEAVLNKLLKPEEVRTILDVGCGSGANFPVLAKFGEVYGVDSSEEAISFLKDKGFEKVFKGELPYLSFDKKFDLITLFDVLEHIEDDGAALRNISQILTDRGLIMLSVPAHKFLWSDYDELVHHKRRYGKKELVAKIQSQGYEIELATYFNTFLAIPAFAVKLIKKAPVINKILPDSELDLNIGPANELLSLIFSSERYLLKHLNFPMGLSLLFVARKRPQN